MNEEMMYTIEEIYTQSIMTNIATLVVEGVDDVPLYDNICRSLSSKYEIVAVENIGNFNQGSEGVISAMSKLQDLPVSQYEIGNYIVGIIDKDVRDFRNEIPVNELVFTLNQYSIESHFASSEVLDNLVSMATRTTKNLRNYELFSFIMNKVERSFSELYLVSLEALRGAVDSGYNSEFCYSYSHGRLRDNQLMEQIKLKENELRVFSNEMGLNYSLTDLKKICKGKWLLNIFCEELEKVIKELPNSCVSNEIEACQFCISQSHEQCLYKLRDGITYKNLKIFAFTQTEINEFDYIRERIESMNLSNAA